MKFCSVPAKEEEQRATGLGPYNVHTERTYVDSPTICHQTKYLIPCLSLEHAKPSRLRHRLQLGTYAVRGDW